MKKRKYHNKPMQHTETKDIQVQERRIPLRAFYHVSMVLFIINGLSLLFVPYDPQMKMFDSPLFNYDSSLFMLKIGEVLLASFICYFFFKNRFFKKEKKADM